MKTASIQAIRSYDAVTMKDTIEIMVDGERLRDWIRTETDSVLPDDFEARCETLIQQAIDDDTRTQPREVPYPPSAAAAIADPTWINRKRLVDDLLAMALLESNGAVPGSVELACSSIVVW